MCVHHSYKFFCGCWREPQAQVTPCMAARYNPDPTTGEPTLCPLEQRVAMIRPTIWKCIVHAPIKQYRGDRDDLYQNMDRAAAEKVWRTGDYKGVAEAPLLQSSNASVISNSDDAPERSNSTTTQTSVMKPQQGRFYANLWNDKGEGEQNG